MWQDDGSRCLNFPIDVVYFRIELEPIARALFPFHDRTLLIQGIQFSIWTIVTNTPSIPQPLNPIESRQLKSSHLLLSHSRRRWHIRGSILCNNVLTSYQCWLLISRVYRVVFVGNFPSSNKFIFPFNSSMDSFLVPTIGVIIPNRSADPRLCTNITDCWGQQSAVSSCSGVQQQRYPATISSSSVQLQRCPAAAVSSSSGVQLAAVSSGVAFVRSCCGPWPSLLAGLQHLLNGRTVVYRGLQHPPCR